VKFPPTCGNPTTFRAKLGERPLQSVMNFGIAATAVVRGEPAISAEFSRAVIAGAGPALAFAAPRNSKAVVHERTQVSFAERLLGATS